MASNTRGEEAEVAAAQVAALIDEFIWK